MEKFKKAYLKFLQRYKDESWFAGAILCGSFATGNNDSNSDIDIFMVSKNTDWRERGTVLTDGFIVEYFINPIGLVEKEIISEQYSLDKCTSTMFNQGIVIYDEFGQVKKLKDLAKNTLKEQSIINEYQFIPSKVSALVKVILTALVIAKRKFLTFSSSTAILQSI